MRIAVVNNFFFPRVGGSAIISQKLAELYQEEGHEVIVITGKYNGAVANNIGSLKIFRIPSWTLPKTKFSFNFDINFCLVPGNSRRVRKILAEFQPDIIHSHGQFLDLSWKSLRWSRLNSVPNVLTLHTRLFSPNQMIDLVFLLLDKFLVSNILRRNKPSAVICIDNFFIKYVKARYKYLTPRIQSIPIGIDLGMFLTGSPKTLPVEKSPEIISIGHIIAVRNRKTLLESLSLLKSRFPDIKLKICGNDYLVPDTINLTRRLGLEEKVTFLGAVPHDSLPVLLAESDLEIHDTHGSGFNLSTIEAMASGVPTIVSSPVDYYPHARLEDGVNTILMNPEDAFDLANKIEKLMTDPQLYQRISQGGREFAKKNFDISNISRKYLDLFHHLMRLK